MDPKYLSPDERPEHDDMMEEAGIDPRTKKRYPADEIKENLIRLLRDAEQAHRPWATYILDDALREGAYKHWKAWDNKRNSMKVYDSRRDAIVPARAVRGTRARDDEGRPVYQRELWLNMTWAQVDQQIDDEEARIAAGQTNREIGLKIRKLSYEAPNSETVREAVEELGLDFDEYLQSDEESA